jgi:hypothetical protein
VEKTDSSITLVGCKCAPAVTPLDGPLVLIAQSVFCGTFSLSHMYSCENIAAASDACKNPSSSLSHTVLTRELSAGLPAIALQLQIKLPKDCANYCMVWKPKPWL